MLLNRSNWKTVINSIWGAIDKSVRLILSFLDEAESFTVYLIKFKKKQALFYNHTKKEVRLLKRLSNYFQQYLRRNLDRCNGYLNKNDRKGYDWDCDERRVRFPFKWLSDYDDKSKDCSFKHRSVEYCSAEYRSVEHRSTEHHRFKQRFYDYRVYNKGKTKAFIIYSDNDDDNASAISRLVSLVFSDSDVKDVFFLEDTSYVFFAEYCRRSCSKTFRYMEAKRMYEKNKIYIKAVK